jgi:hypothetical protein
MNIFVLDQDPYKAARYHCDKHVCKMIVESAQILSTVLRKKGFTDDILYKSTHQNHPCVLWVEKSYGNFKWLLDLLDGLLTEYGIRYNKLHKTGKIYNWIDCIDISIYEYDWRTSLKTDFILCMPDEYKTNDPVESYRNYYINDKKEFAKWKIETPWWWK